MIVIEKVNADTAIHKPGVYRFPYYEVHFPCERCGTPLSVVAKNAKEAAWVKRRMSKLCGCVYGREFLLRLRGIWPPDYATLHEEARESLARQSMQSWHRLSKERGTCPVPGGLL